MKRSLAVHLIAFATALFAQPALADQSDKLIGLSEEKLVSCAGTILWKMLVKKGIVTLESQVAAVGIFDKRHDFHHLNKKIETDYQKLEARALACINDLYVIESHVFDYGIVEGKLYPSWPRYWPASKDEPEHISVNLRNV